MNKDSENEERSEAIRRLGDKVRQLEEQLRSRSSEVRQLEMQVEKLNVAVAETRRLYHGMRTSFSWRLTWPLRVLRDAGVSSIHKIRRRFNLPLSAAKLGLDPYANHLATLIRRSEFFDVDVYEATAEARAQGLDPALHYVLVGEHRGLKPSPAFDPVYYAERYPEVAAWGGNRLGHYLETGRAEGKRALPLADTLTLGLAGI